jgi:hypothetical protein
MRCSLRLVACAPPEVALPLLGAIYAAPLSLILNPDFTTWLLGATGSFKSELATLAQRHLGDFERTRLPISWCATEATIEHVLHAAKDTLCVIDDYAPQPDLQGQREQARRAERVLRNIGNRAGRSRMRPDLTQRPVRVPRGLVVSTGEDLPPSRSIVARLVVLEVDKDGIDLDELTAGRGARLSTRGRRAVASARRTPGARRRGSPPRRPRPAPGHRAGSGAPRYVRSRRPPGRAPWNVAGQVQGSSAAVSQRCAAVVWTAERTQAPRIDGSTNQQGITVAVSCRSIWASLRAASPYAPCRPAPCASVPTSCYSPSAPLPIPGWWIARRAPAYSRLRCCWGRVASRRTRPRRRIPPL